MGAVAAPMAATAPVHSIVVSRTVANLQSSEAAHPAGRQRLGRNRGPPDAPLPLLSKLILSAYLYSF